MNLVPSLAASSFCATPLLQKRLDSSASSLVATTIHAIARKVVVTRQAQRVLLGQHNASVEGSASKMVLKGRHALVASAANRTQLILPVGQEDVIKEAQRIPTVGVEGAAVKP